MTVRNCVTYAFDRMHRMTISKPRMTSPPGCGAGCETCASPKERRNPAYLATLGVLVLLAGCGLGPERGAVSSQSCASAAGGPDIDALANCMMNVVQQRKAQEAADRRAAEARDAADKRAQ